MAKERALDIFQLLDDVDRKRYDAWDKLTPEQRKELSPLVAMRWMAGTSNPVQLILLNELVNVSVFALGDHKELMLKLLTVCSQGGPKRYGWVPYKVSGGKVSKRAVALIAEHYRLSLKEAEDNLPLFSPDDLRELGELHGLQKDELKELLK